MNLEETLRTYFDNTARVLQNTNEKEAAAIAETLIAAKRRGAAVFTAGNGGSSATASHFTNDLMKGCRVGDDTGLKAICLSDSSPVVTCLANDFCYADIFKIQLETLAKKGDVLCVFTGSGNSEDIVRAAKAAKESGMTVIGFLGRDGGNTKPLCDEVLFAKTDCMETIEDIHMTAVHAIASAVRSALEEG